VILTNLSWFGPIKFLDVCVYSAFAFSTKSIFLYPDLGD
jgi:hypothetical protein